MRAALLILVLVFQGVAFAVADSMSAFETGDLIELISTNGSPTVVTAAARTGERGLLLDASGEWARYSVVTKIPNDKYIVGVCVRMADATPASAQLLFRSTDTTSNDVAIVQLQTDGTLHLIEEDGSTVVVNGTTVLQDNTWHCIEIYIEVATIGSAELFVDGSSEGTGTGDFDPLGNVTGVEFNYPSTATHFDDFYSYDDVSAASDRCSVDSSRLCEVFWFSGGPASTTPDDSGDVLDLGQWEDLSDMPVNATNGAEYNVTAAKSGMNLMDDVGTGSCSGGPSGCAEFDGTSEATQFMLYGERSGGGATTFYLLRDDQLTATRVVVPLATTPSWFVSRVSEALSPTLNPSASEYCAMGIEKSSGGQDHEPWELWCYVLHLPPDRMMLISEKHGEASTIVSGP